ncbi:uncharacterized protein [Gossypium hirsutum]|uniref:Aspartic peptidase DDI1-type domain-containing protein n=1 Tax=Gossypium hirsutum TaxID=3635 RepID=A0A1U8MUI2_GOSHI|nr:uncharacterized protein LOC107941446 [Gossypium hirsutum]
MVKKDALIQSQVATLKNLESQMGQLAMELRNRPQGTLPRNTKNPRKLGKQHCKVVTLRSGKTLEPKTVVIEDEPIGKKESRSIVEIPTPVEPELTNFDEVKSNLKQDVQLKKYLDVLKQLHINISLVEALEQMPNYVKLMKDILSKKKILLEYETTTLTKDCNVFLQNKLTSKLKDPGSFTIPCNISESYYGKTLCDLGVSNNLMPKSTFKLLGIGEVRPTTVTIQLTDQSLAYLKGKIEDVLILK